MIFMVSPRKYMGDEATIVTLDDDGREVPILHLMQGDIDYPGPVEHLAANLASLLNGHEPLHPMDIGNHRMLWRPDANGVELRLQRLEEGK